VLAAVVVVVALVVVAVGTLRGRSSGEVTVTGGSQPAPTVPSPSGGGPVPSGPAAVGSVAPSASAAVAAVYVLGAVRHAGVVEVPVGTRVDAVLERAGGAAADADLARLNLARAVVDGERLYVPRVGETSVPEALGPDVAGGSGVVGSGAGSGVGGGVGSAAGGPDAVVDLNTADQATLETLPGIGQALAGRIIAWREEHGGFSSVDDLLDVSGIGQARLDDLRDRVRV
jgi:competence protein ComEA